MVPASADQNARKDAIVSLLPILVPPAVLLTFAWIGTPVTRRTRKGLALLVSLYVIESWGICYLAWFSYTHRNSESNKTLYAVIAIVVGIIATAITTYYSQRSAAGGTGSSAN